MLARRLVGRTPAHDRGSRRQPAARLRHEQRVDRPDLRPFKHKWFHLARTPSFLLFARRIAGALARHSNAMPVSDFECQFVSHHNWIKKSLR